MVKQFLGEIDMLFQARGNPSCQQYQIYDLVIYSVYCILKGRDFWRLNCHLLFQNWLLYYLSKNYLHFHFFINNCAGTALNCPYWIWRVFLSHRPFWIYIMEGHPTGTASRQTQNLDLSSCHNKQFLTKISCTIFIDH